MRSLGLIETNQHGNHQQTGSSPFLSGLLAPVYLGVRKGPPGNLIWEGGVGGTLSPSSFSPCLPLSPLSLSPPPSSSLSASPPLPLSFLLFLLFPPFPLPLPCPLGVLADFRAGCVLHGIRAGQKPRPVPFHSRWKREPTMESWWRTRRPLAHSTGHCVCFGHTLGSIVKGAGA